MGSLSTPLLPAERHREDVESTIRVRRGETVAHETIRVRRDGTPVPVFVIASPIYDEVDRITGVSLIIRDVSDQAASREHLSLLLAELFRREQELERADRRKDEFIATLAHELRNPLAPIRNAVAILRLAPSLPERAVWAREVIDRQVGQMTELLEDLLDVSRITRQMITIKRDRFPIATAVTQAIEIAQPLIDQRGHRLDLRIDPEPLEVQGDLTRLTQIFGNLLNNAAKYTDPAGTITLTVERHGDAVEIRVQDTGIGIDQEHLPRIFELFSQVRSALDRSHGGLGIGLYLVKGLVELHRGTIEVASGGLGTGTVFVVTLPLAVGEAPAADTGGRRSEPWLVPPARGRRILIADDNRDETASLALLLRIQDYQVETAADGEEAVAKAESFKPDILLLDLGMPKLNGYEVSRRIRAKPWGADIVIIAYSGWGRPEDRNRSAEAGVDLHLSKPVAPSRLLEVFQSSLEARLHDADS